MAKAPRGYLVFTPTRATASYTAESRTTAVKGLDNLNQLVPAAESLGRHHVYYDVTGAHYETVGVTLLWALERGLGETFTPAVRDLQVCKPGSPSSHGPTAC